MFKILSLGKPEYKGAGDVLSKVVKNEVSLKKNKTHVFSQNL